MRNSEIDKENISFLYRGCVLALSKCKFKLRGGKELRTWLGVRLVRKVPASPGLELKLPVAGITQQFFQIGTIHGHCSDPPSLNWSTFCVTLAVT